MKHRPAVFILTIGFATAGAWADDAANAKSAAVAFFRALGTEDNTFIEDHFVGGPADRKLLTVFRDLVRDGNTLREASLKKFGPDAAKAGVGAFDPSQMSADIEKFDVQIKDATAFLKRPGSDSDGVALVFENGIWKVQSLSGSPGKAAQLSAFLPNFGPVMKDITAGINNDKFKSINDARATFNERQAAVLKAYLATQTTQPAAQPAAKPNH